MPQINEDPIYDIRVAIADALRYLNVPCEHKRLTDLAVDNLPDFFRQPLQGVDNKFLELVDWLESEEDSCHAALEECVKKGYKDLECAHLKGSDVARATIEWIQKNVLEATGEQEP